MVDTRTIPALPQRGSDEIYSPGGKVRIWGRISCCLLILIVINLLICIPFPSRNFRRINTSRPAASVTSKLASTEKFVFKRTLSVGLQLTAFLHITNSPDIYGVFWAALERSL